MRAARCLSVLTMLSVLGAFTLACGGSAETEEAPPPPITAADETPPSPTQAPAEAPAQGLEPATRSPSHVSKETCQHQCAILTEVPYELVKDNFCGLCGHADKDACEFDWPTNDVPTCDIYDRFRNCIYATYGYTFKDPKWRKEFESQPWYKADPNFKPEKMSDVATANIEYLKRAKAEKIGCMD
ncbi:MAG: YARHG domain-containing protein [Deltaproteobacteria bacterium]|nr:YARHG domain-containing protein [Deltaproteobacteria bacterium]